MFCFKNNISSNSIEFIVSEFDISVNDEYSCCSVKLKDLCCLHISRILYMLDNNIYYNKSKKLCLLNNENSIYNKYKNIVNNMEIYKFKKYIKYTVIFDFLNNNIVCSCSSLNICSHILFITIYYFGFDKIDINLNIKKIFNLCKFKFLLNKESNIIFFTNNIYYKIHIINNEIFCDCLLDEKNIFYGLNCCDHIYYYIYYKYNIKIEKKEYKYSNILN